LGSNGAEVQTITSGENQNVHIRLLLAEIVECEVKLGELPVQKIPGALVMDS
jgi:hypothetical protein